MTKKIVITGPESTGKTTLTRDLALHFGAVRVQEYSRWYLDRREGAYAEADLSAIARGQKRWERYGSARVEDLFFCDTSLEVIEIWSRYKYGRLRPALEQELVHPPADLYLLCYPDLNWEPDPLRENPADREELFGWYERWMEEHRAGFWVIKGYGKERLASALEGIQSLILA